VRRLYLDLVNQAEIAARTGKTRAAVSNWVSGQRLAGNAFPKPYAFASGALWAWADVNEWLRRTTGEAHDGTTYPTPAEVDRANVALEDRSRTPAGVRVSEVTQVMERLREVEQVIRRDSGLAWQRSASLAGFLVEGDLTATSERPAR
jgi:predicted DNA-binding transcriptional regulator AlpA